MSSMAGRGGRVGHGLTRDQSVAHVRLRRGTVRRVAGYARPYAGSISVFLLIALVDAALDVLTPLLLRHIIDNGVIPGDRQVIISTAAGVGLVAVASFVLAIVGRSVSARIGEGLIFDLRTQVFDHVLRQPVAFFTRSQTGALVSRLNTDVVGAQQAFTSTLGSTISSAASLVMVLAAMASMSWELTAASLLLVPLYLIPARLVGRRVGALQRAQMSYNADLGSRMTERFNVAGALLVKLFGNSSREHEGYAERADRVRRTGIRIAQSRVVFMAGMALVAALATAVVYGFGGLMVVAEGLSVGSLVALTALLGRLYGPLTALSSARVDVMSAMISFERVFEIMDLRPLVADPEHPQSLPDGPLSVELDGVSFAYPSAERVSLASLEQVGSGDRAEGELVLRDVTLSVGQGELVALVGPSGAGKSTLTALVARLYDPTSGAVRLGGTDAREVSQADLRQAVGMVTQEAHMFHDTIRANLAYANPVASEAAMWDALDAAQVGALVRGLPEGLDTVVGDRGHRLSGGEKQRLAIARLLLKGPGIVVLDEATAHLDSESELAVQRALDTALAGRTALVIAHRLSTVRGADRIAVLDGGRIVQLGTHEELLAAGGLYEQLYRTQFREA